MEFDLSTTGADEKTLKGLLLDGRYRITELLGEGAMGRVYSGIQVSVARKVAIKVIKEEVSNDPQLRRRFLEEAKTLASFSHPNIVGLHDFGESGEGVLYAVLDYVEGVELGEAVAGRQMSLEFVLVLAGQIAAALSEAHSRGVIHRDLKPDNVFVTRVAHGALQFRLLDFGISRPIEDSDLTTEEGIYGTPTYLSPEQAKARPPVVQSDFYALGVILYQMLTAQHLFEFRSVVQVVLSHANDPPPDVRAIRPDVPSDVAMFLLRMLAKDPAVRPRDAVELMELIEGLQESHGIRGRLRTQRDGLDEYVFATPELGIADTFLDGTPAPDISSPLFEDSEALGDFFAPSIPATSADFSDGSIEFDNSTLALPADDDDFGLMSNAAGGAPPKPTGLSFDDSEPGLSFEDSEVGLAFDDRPQERPPEPLEILRQDPTAEIAPQPFVVRPPPESSSNAPMFALALAVVAVLGGAGYWLASGDDAPIEEVPEVTEVIDDEPAELLEPIQIGYQLPPASQTRDRIFSHLQKAMDAGWKYRGDGSRRTDTEETASFVLERQGSKVLVSFTFADPEELAKLPKPRPPEVSLQMDDFVVFMGPVGDHKVPYDLRQALTP